MAHVSAGSVSMSSPSSTSTVSSSSSSALNLPQQQQLEQPTYPSSRDRVEAILRQSETELSGPGAEAERALVGALCGLVWKTQNGTIPADTRQREEEGLLEAEV